MPTGTLTATLNITDNALGSPQHVALTGNVIDPVAKFSPTKLAFGTRGGWQQHDPTGELTNSRANPAGHQQHWRCWVGRIHGGRQLPGDIVVRHELYDFGDVRADGKGCRNGHANGHR